MQVHLKSDHLSSELNLGCITRINPVQGRADFRGDGFELRTDGHGVVRADKGLILTSFGKQNSQGYVKDIAQTTAQLEQATEQHQARLQVAIDQQCEERNIDATVSCDLTKQVNAVKGVASQDKENGKSNSYGKYNRFSELANAQIVVSSPTGIANISMLHFECFTGKGHSLDSAVDLTAGGIYKRRSDLIDPLDILLEGYKATFIKPVSDNTKTGGRIPINQLKLSEEGEKFIKGWESIYKTKDNQKSYYYNDDAGYCTVGWGHLVNGKKNCASQGKKHMSDTITMQEAQRIFDIDKVNKGENIVKNAIKVPLFQHEFDALVSLAFNVGDLNKIAPKLCKLINETKYVEGSNEMLDITKSNGKELSGLIKRRKKEHNIFNKAVYDAIH